MQQIPIYSNRVQHSLAVSDARNDDLIKEIDESN
jgi:hypothetical protein